MQCVGTDRLARAKEMMRRENLTCVILGNQTVYTSTQRGIRPLVYCFRQRLVESGASASDKVVGKAAAFLYVLLGIRELYADVVSTGALQVLQQAGISVSFATKTDRIINRAGTGLCPMETAVLFLEDPIKALVAIEDALARMKAA